MISVNNEEPFYPAIQLSFDWLRSPKMIKVSRDARLLLLDCWVYCEEQRLKSFEYDVFVFVGKGLSKTRIKKCVVELGNAGLILASEDNMFSLEAE